MAVHQVRRTPFQFRLGCTFEFRSMRGREGVAQVLEVREYAVRPLYCRWEDSAGEVHLEDFHPNEFMFTKEVRHNAWGSSKASS